MVLANVHFIAAKAGISTSLQSGDRGFFHYKNGEVDDQNE